MSGGILSRLGSGLIGNISAQSLALLVQLVVALVTIPVFANLWGLETFGVWLILFTLPAYIALVDFGFVGAAANAMTAAQARGEQGEATVLYRQLTGATFMLAVLVLVIAAFAISRRPTGLLDFAQDAAGGFAGLTVLALTAYAVMALCSRAIGTSLRATGHYAKSAYCIALTALIDVSFAVAFAVAGGGLAGAALGYALGQSIGLVIMLWLARSNAPQFMPTVFDTSWSALKPLSGPALALITVALGQAVLLQGTVVVLGMAAGAAAVPAFTAMRTLARLGVQAVAVINQAVMPELTIAQARSDDERSRDLVALNLTVALGIVVPGSIALGLFGSQIVELWSVGAIAADPMLAAAMAGVLLFGGLAGALASFLTAINEQARFAPALLVAAGIGLILALPLARTMGATGTALAVLLVELAMLTWTFRAAERAGFGDLNALAQAPSRAAAFLRRRSFND